MDVDMDTQNASVPVLQYEHLAPPHARWPIPDARATRGRPSIGFPSVFKLPLESGAAQLDTRHSSLYALAPPPTELIDSTSTLKWLGLAVGVVVGGMAGGFRSRAVGDNSDVAPELLQSNERNKPKETTTLLVQGVELKFDTAEVTVNPETGATTGGTIENSVDLPLKLVEIAEKDATAGLSEEAYKRCELALDALMEPPTGEMSVPERMGRIHASRRIAELLTRLKAAGAQVGDDDEELALFEAVCDAGHVIFDSQRGQLGGAKSEDFELDISRIQVAFSDQVPKADVAQAFVRLGDFYAKNSSAQDAISCYVYAINVHFLDDSTLPRVDTFDPDLYALEFWWTFEVGPQESFTKLRTAASLQLSNPLLNRLGIEYKLDVLAYNFDTLDEDEEGTINWGTSLGGMGDAGWDELMKVLLKDGSLREMAGDEQKAREYLKELELSSGDVEQKEPPSVESIDWEARTLDAQVALEGDSGGPGFPIPSDTLRAILAMLAHSHALVGEYESAVWLNACALQTAAPLHVFHGPQPLPQYGREIDVGIDFQPVMARATGIGSWSPGCLPLTSEFNEILRACKTPKERWEALCNNDDGPLSPVVVMDDEKIQAYFVEVERQMRLAEGKDVGALDAEEPESGSNLSS
ncbi:hypothetical protein MKEN_00421800 [Mycena kentingensis (nom. inval.)]|nr:hypothetical protein MKEN_00421800 [Mycena kentingensis (nom. inval.)]